MSRRTRAGDLLGQSIAVLFMVGAACFAIGSTAGYSSLVGVRATGVTYCVGSIFFTSAAYLQYVQCINPGAPGSPGRRRLLAVDAGRIDWWASTVQLAGTLFFNVTTLTALDASLNAKQEDLVVWTPDATVARAFVPTGRAVSVRQAHFQRIRDGRVVEHWAVRDDQGMATQAGWVPPTLTFLIRCGLATRKARRSQR